ncbi:MAG: hypothetical protein QXG04_01815 [Sulfolobales archaeon]
MLKTREVVRMYSIPIRDKRVEELVTWYTKMLQKAVDIIWENIVWEYRFPQLSRRRGVISVKVGCPQQAPALVMEVSSSSVSRWMTISKASPFRAGRRS